MADPALLVEMAHVCFFSQIADEGFKDPARKVTESELLPTGTPVDSLAKKTNAARSTRQIFYSGHRTTSEPSEASTSAWLPAELTGALVASRSLLGTQNALLDTQIREGREFFKRLEEQLTRSGTSGREIADILREFYELCWGRMGTGGRWTVDDKNKRFFLRGWGGWSAVLDRAELKFSDELVGTLVRLEKWAKVEPTSLLDKVARWYVAMNHKNEAYALALDALPGAAETMSETETMSEAECLALAVGLYLTSWERLRMLEGSVAIQLAQKARGAFKELVKK